MNRNLAEGRASKLLALGAALIQDAAEIGVALIYFVPSSTREAGHSLEFFRFSTGSIEQVSSLEGPPGYGLSVSPDGRSILFAEPDELQSDIMLVE